MLSPDFTVVTEFTWVSPEELYLDSFLVFRDEHQNLLIGSEVVETIVYNDDGHPKRNRYWTNLQDAQAWVDAVTAFATENNFDVRTSIQTV